MKNNIFARLDYSFFKEDTKVEFYNKIQPDWIFNFTKCLESDFNAKKNFENQSKNSWDMSYLLPLLNISNYYENFYLNGDLKTLIKEIMLYNKKNSIGICFKIILRNGFQNITTSEYVNYSEKKIFYDALPGHKKLVSLFIELLKCDFCLGYSTYFNTDYTLKHSVMYCDSLFDFQKGFSDILKKYQSILDDKKLWNHQNNIKVLKLSNMLDNISHLLTDEILLFEKLGVLNNHSKVKF